MAFFNSTRTVKFSVNKIDDNYTTDTKTPSKVQYLVGYLSKKRLKKLKLWKKTLDWIISNLCLCKIWKEKNKKYFGIFR